MTDRYRAFNLTIVSELALPELSRCLANKTADVAIRLGPAVRPDSTGAVQLGPSAWACPQWLWMEVAQVATFLVRHGREIIVQPFPGIDDDSVRLFLLGSVIGALLLQRGHLVLHGNAIVLGDGALVCLGESGAGKSTLAHRFQHDGYRVLADDVVAIDERQQALPGIPRVRLWRDVIDRLGVPDANLVRVRPALEKYALALPGERQSEKAFPVRWVCVLKAAHVDAVTIEPVSGRAAFGLLFDNLYRPLLAQHTLAQAALLAHLGGLAGAVRLAVVRRPIAGFALDELAAALRAFAGPTQ